MFKSTQTALGNVSRALSRAQTRGLHSQTPRRVPPHVSSGKLAAASVGALGALAAYRYFGNGLEVHADFVATVGVPALSIEDQRSKLSAQHVQVQASLESPGVYVWGDNSGKVIDPTSNERVIKSPRRLTMFDGVLLRDLKLDKEVGGIYSSHLKLQIPSNSTS